MRAVLYREIVSYNKLLAVIIKSLGNLQKALQGLEVMTAELEQLGSEILMGVVPSMWKQHSYMSLKPLTSWVSDLISRTRYFSNWIKNGEPRVFWISGFFLPRNLLI